MDSREINVIPRINPSVAFRNYPKKIRDRLFM